MDIEQARHIQARLYWDSCCCRSEWKQVAGSLALLSEGVMSRFPIWAWGWGWGPGWMEGWLSWSAHLLGGAVWVFGLLYLVHNLPQLQLSLVPYGFFIFYCSRRLLTRCNHWSKGSQVWAHLTGTNVLISEAWWLHDYFLKFHFNCSNLLYKLYVHDTFCNLNFECLLLFLNFRNVKHLFAVVNGLFICS